jgi:hypothetical protein
LAVGLGAHALVAGVGEDLLVDGVGERVDQAGVAGLGDVGDGVGPDLAAEQHPAAGVGDDQRLHGVHPARARDEAVATGLVGGRAAHADLGGVDDSGLIGGAQVGDHVSEGSKPQAGRHLAAARGQERVDLADRAGDGRAVDAEPAGEYVVGDAVS